MRFWRRILFRSRREQLYRELAEEIDFHRSMAQAADGWECGNRLMGNVTLATEDCRNMWSFVGFEKLLQDVRFACRMFRRTPGFTTVAALSLTIGIGGNAAIFSLVDNLLVRPLPYREPDRLLRVTGIYPRAAVPFFQERNRSMEMAAVSMGSEFNLTGHGAAIRIFGSAASANLFSVLGASVARGRAFEPGEDLPGRDSVAIISDALWKAKFGGDPAILGRVLTWDGVNRQIVGVMPPDFSFPSAKVEAWAPLRLDSTRFLEYWGGGFVPLIGRLRPGATVEQAQGEVRTLTTQFRRTFPYPMARDWNADSVPIPLQQDVVGDVRGRLIILLCSVGVVLLIACANVAGLLLARATTRRREIALRVALGAGRARIVRQVLTESLLLAVAGGALGIGLGVGVLSIFKSVLPAATPGLAAAAIDWRIAGAMGALALLTGIAFGIAPALSASRIQLADSIRTGGQRSTTSGWARLRSGLVAAEVALTVVLVIGAGLLMRSLYTLSQVNLGFEPARVLTVRISPDKSACIRRAACTALYDRLVAAGRGLAGVEDATIANTLPLDEQQPNLPVDVEDHPKTADHPAPLFWAGAIGPGYLRLMHIPLVAGREFSDADSAQAAPVLLITTATARHFWPNEDPIGKHIKSAGEPKWRTVVGVVSEVRQYGLGKDRPGFIPGAMYMPYAQSIRDDGQLEEAMILLVKTRSGAGPIADELRVLAQAQDPGVPVGPVQPLEKLVAASIADFRSTIRVFLSFAGAAILLAAIGIYGLVSYWVTQRTFEIGVRVAMGASRGGIVSMVLAQGVRVALYGAAAGTLASLAVTRFLASLLFGVSATDPLTFLGVPALVLAVTVLATVFPAGRAARIDPVRSLRAE